MNRNEGREKPIFQGNCQHPFPPCRLVTAGKVVKPDIRMLTKEVLTYSYRQTREIQFSHLMPLRL
jgi:hypothetical protein